MQTLEKCQCQRILLEKDFNICQLKAELNASNQWFLCNWKSRFESKNSWMTDDARRQIGSQNIVSSSYPANVSTSPSNSPLLTNRISQSCSSYSEYKEELSQESYILVFFYWLNECTNRKSGSDKSFQIYYTRLLDFLWARPISLCVSLLSHF